MNGILFKSWESEAIANGGDKLWQTRRVMKPQPPDYCDSVEQLKTGRWNFYKSSDPDFHAYLKDKPRYQEGEVLYIRESWWCPDKGLPVAYKANLEPQQADKHVWKSPLFMPAWAARRFIRILSVRPERLQEITEEDCVGEFSLNKWLFCYEFVLTERPK